MMMNATTTRYPQASDIQKMKDLRAQGMSTRQIVKETGFSDKTVVKYAGSVDPFGKGKRMGEEDIQKMQALRDQGLSNSQIAIEMGITSQTVVRHIGRQKKGARAMYGSVVAHADGEHFAHDPMPGFTCLSRKVAAEENASTVDPDMNNAPDWLKEALGEKPEKKETDTELFTLKSIVTYSGHKLLYTVDSNGTIDISESDFQNGGIRLSFKEFNQMLEELMQLIDKIPQK